jgi:hypothetical protein
MNRITTENVAAAIRKVKSMNLPQKEELAEEIHRDQPHLLASCLVQPKLGAHINDVEFLLNIAGVLSSDEGVGFAVANDH